MRAMICSKAALPILFGVVLIVGCGSNQGTGLLRLSISADTQLPTGAASKLVISYPGGRNHIYQEAFPPRDRSTLPLLLQVPNLPASDEPVAYTVQGVDGSGCAVTKPATTPPVVIKAGAETDWIGVLLLKSNISCTDGGSTLPSSDDGGTSDDASIRIDTVSTGLDASGTLGGEAGSALPDASSIDGVARDVPDDVPQGPQWEAGDRLDTADGAGSATPDLPDGRPTSETLSDIPLGSGGTAGAGGALGQGGSTSNTSGGGASGLGGGGVGGGGGGETAATGGMPSTGGNAVGGNVGATGGATGGTTNLGQGGGTGTGGSKSLGNSCSLGNECASQYCADGVCCDKPCGGCLACLDTMTGKASGTCSFALVGSDPHETCTPDTPPCGHDGTCDGAGACRLVASGTSCGSSCSAAALTPMTCDGSGNCLPGTPATCPGSLTCSDATTCKTTCSTNADCSTGNCLGPTCGAAFAPGDAMWARSSAAADGYAEFRSVAVDGSGNIYVAGSVAGSLTLGDKTVTAPATDALLVKYDSSGNVIWVKTPTNSTSAMDSNFQAVAVDGSGNVYAAGRILGTYTYTFGSKTVAASGTWGNLVLVKFDSAGTALWATANSTGGSATGNTAFHSLATDTAGNVYVAGEIWGTDTFTLGSKTVVGQASAGPSPILAKYDAAGTALWAKGVTVTSTTSSSSFLGIAVDPSANVFAAGIFSSYGNPSPLTYNFGGQSVSGAGGVLVKYNSAGTAQWLVHHAGSASSDGAEPYSAATDSSGNVYVAGRLLGTIAFGSTTLTSSNGTKDGYVAKYSSQGTPQWAAGTSASTSAVFSGVAVDNAGNVYAGGDAGKGTTSVGTPSVTPPAGLTQSVLMTRFNSSGTTQWARSIVSGTGASEFVAVAVDAAGHAYAVGTTHGSGAYNFGPQSAAGASTTTNPIIVQYKQ